MVPVHFPSLGALTLPLVLDINEDGVQVIHHGLPAYSLPGPSWDNKGTGLELALGTNSGNDKDCTCQGEACYFCTFLWQQTLELSVVVAISGGWVFVLNRDLQDSMGQSGTLHPLALTISN